MRNAIQCETLRYAHDWAWHRDGCEAWNPGNGMFEAPLSAINPSKRPLQEIEARIGNLDVWCVMHGARWRWTVTFGAGSYDGAVTCAEGYASSPRACIEAIRRIYH